MGMLIAPLGVLLLYSFIPLFSLLQDHQVQYCLSEVWFWASFTQTSDLQILYILRFEQHHHTCDCERVVVLIKIVFDWQKPKTNENSGKRKVKWFVSMFVLQVGGKQFKSFVGRLHIMKHFHFHHLTSEGARGVECF